MTSPILPLSLIETNCDKGIQLAQDHENYGGDETHQSFRSAIILRILQAGVSDGRCVNKRSNFRHVSETELVEHAGVGIFQLTQVDILFDILVFAPELSKASKEVHIAVQRGGSQSARKSRAFDGYWLKSGNFK